MSKKKIIPPTKVIKAKVVLLLEEIEIPVIYEYLTGTMFYPTGEGTRSIIYRGISFFKSEGNNSILNRIDKSKGIICLSLADLVAELAPEDFMRIGNTVIVNLHEVEGIAMGEGLTVIMKNPIKANGQHDYHIGGEIEVDGAPKNKAELLRRLATIGKFIKRR
jgi:hypothetical protein